MDYLEGRGVSPVRTANSYSIESSGATEVRGCLLKNFLDMRKRSLVRSESEDSGFYLEPYEPMAPPPFDAERFLEELGFAGSYKPLIPDRFIPSLIHRISDMPDETMKQLDHRVWKSIDSFKQKEHMTWYFTNSSMECDLCINSLQRAYSCPTPVCRESCGDYPYSGNDLCITRSNSSSVVRVQNWLAHFQNNSFAGEKTTILNPKANIGHIGNQPSAESGFLSFAGDEESFVGSNNAEGYDLSALYDSYDRDDSFELLASKTESSEPTHVVVVGNSRTWETKESRTSSATSQVCATQTMNTTTFLFSKATAKDQSKLLLPRTTTVFASSVCERLPMYNGGGNHSVSDVCKSLEDKTNSCSNENVDHSEPHSKSTDQNLSSVITAESEERIHDSRRFSLKKMRTDGQLFLFLPDMDNLQTETTDNKVCPETEYCHCNSNNTGSEDAQKVDKFNLPLLLSNDHDENQPDSVSTFTQLKKRHSFDAAYASINAAEKRKLFRLSHARSQNFLFERESGCLSRSRVSEAATDDTGPLSDLKEEQQWRHTTEQDSSSQDNPGQFASSVESTEECWESLPSECETSEQYFSCDESFGENGETFAEDDPDFTKDNTEVEQRSASVKTASHIPSSDRNSFLNYYESACTPNRTIFTIGRENFILSKVLRHGLKVSILGDGAACKISQHLSLQNGRLRNEAIPSSLSKCRLLEPSVKSRTDTTETSSDSVHNPHMRVEPVGGRTSDKTEVADNGDHRLSKSFAHRHTLSSDMCTPKCEARLIKYDGLALFWSARNIPEIDINSCSERIHSKHHSSDLMHLDSDSSANLRFTSGVRMDINSDSEMQNTSDKVYFNQVCIEVNSEEANGGNEKKRIEKDPTDEKFHLGNVSTQEDQDEVLRSDKTSTNSENPCGRALKDLEDLRTAIQKAKETRMSASRELKLLQELLQGGDNEEDETSSARVVSTVDEPTLSRSQIVKSASGNQRSDRNIQALSELQQKSSTDTSQNKEFWEERIRKAKEEMSQGCHEKLSIMEQKLRTTEEDLAKALDENERLKDQLELRSSALTVCECNTEAHIPSYSHMNGISEEDAKITSVVTKPSVPTNFWEEWDRLQSDLMKAERKADELNILLNQKLIELNKMQLTLSKQTKEMMLLEKAYFQLRCHLSQRRLNKSALSQQSSSLARALSTPDRTSEDDSKTSDPEIPP